ncbi:hypothetical protein ACLKA7_011798 [Drosophila subpalustris]
MKASACDCKDAANSSVGPQVSNKGASFTDEKLFTVEQSHNHQNDSIWSEEAPGTSAIVEDRQNPKSVMVWGGNCASGKKPLIFVD